MASKDWLEVIVDCQHSDTEDLEAWLFAAGALSVTLGDGIDDDRLEHAVLEPAPGEIRLWKNITLVGLFDQGSTENAVRDALAIACLDRGVDSPPYRLRRLHDQVWERAWMDSFKPMQFGHRLWICPKEAVVEDTEAVTIRLDPGMAFGTGTHATTAQCLAWLGEKTHTTRTPLANQSVIDYGCGSGVLAIASLLLGAEHVWAVDIDEQAIIATTENAVFNGVEKRLSVGFPEILGDAKADVLLANILFQPLMELADTLSDRVKSGGFLVMSGILEEQMQPLRMRYNERFIFKAERASEGWALMTAIRR